MPFGPVFAAYPASPQEARADTPHHGPGGARDRLILVFLAVVALVAMVLATTELLRLIDDQSERAAILRDDVTTLVFGADSTLRGLHAQAEMIANGAAPGHHGELLRQFSDLSRLIGQLNRGTFALDLETREQLSAWSHGLSHLAADIGPLISGLDPREPTYRIKVMEIAFLTGTWTNLSTRMLERTAAGANALRTSEAQFRKDVGDRLALMSLLLLLAFLGICGLLFVQLRNLRRLNRHLLNVHERGKRNIARARSASRAKSAFLAAMSHEIRTPLAAIIGSAELLALRPLPEGTDRQLRTITAQAFLLRDLIDGILDFSRLEAGRIDTRHTETDLGALADLLSGAFADEARRAGLDLSIDLPPMRVMVDDVRLRQILVNLIGNALKFTPSGRVMVRGALPMPALLRVEVQDDGIGIPAADMPRLFREFSQIDASHSRSHGGSGLGLAICHRVVTGLGGRIGVKSTPGKGSLFWFELPVAAVPSSQDQSDPAALPAPQPADAPAEVPCPPLRILVAEDNEINREVVEGLLRHMGHNVHVARDGHEAVSAAFLLAPDLVLMDMQMPRMDGLAATRLIRADQPDLPIIAVTANAFAEDRHACLAAGMSDFLPKPLTRETLAAVIARHCPDRRPPVAGAAGTAFAALAEEFDPATLSGLLTRFSAGIDDLRTTLLDPCRAANDPASQDAALHGFAGAALTLGLSRTGEAARALRRKLPADSGDVAALVAIAQSDVADALCHLKGKG